MPIKTTCLRDVFKKTVKDSIGYPTIWIGLDGKEHQDFKWTKITGIDLENAGLNIKTGVYTIPGTIVQIGSHVTHCYTLGCNLIQPDSYEDIHFEKGRLFYNLFRHAKNLTYIRDPFLGSICKVTKIPEDLLWGCPNLVEAEGLFDVSSIETIPEQLFWNCPKLKILRKCFSNCKVKTIPENLFVRNPELKNLDFCFYTANIESIPETLFYNNNKLDSLFYTFASNSRLKEVPEKLFYYCPHLYNVNYCFSTCFSLTGIPKNLFKHNPRILSTMTVMSPHTIYL